MHRTANIYVLFCLVLLSCLQVSASPKNRASFLKTNELLAETADRFSKLFDDVESIKEDVALIAGQLSNGGYSKNEGQPVRIDGARVTVAQRSETEVEISVDHGWENIGLPVWVVSLTYILPEERYTQSVEPGRISILLPLEEVKRSNGFFEMGVTLLVTLGDDTYGFTIDIPTALNSENKTFETSTTYGELRENLKLDPLGVKPSDTILYSPGDIFTLGLEVNQTNLKDGSLHFYSVSPDPDEPVAVSYNVVGDERTNRVNSVFSFPKEREPEVEVNSASLTTGGLLYAILMYRSDGEVVSSYITMKLIKLNLQNTNSPIPEGRVAIVGEHYVNQTIRLGSKTGHVSCETVGNPPPNVEIRINGDAIDTVSGFWVFPFGSLVTTYDIPVEQLLGGAVTCYADNAGGDAEMAIRVMYELTALRELNKANMLEDGKILEATCAFKGNPSPFITFYRNTESGSNILSEADGTVDIKRFHEEFLSEATMRLDVSADKDIYGITCVGESDGQRVESFVYIDY